MAFYRKKKDDEIRPETKYKGILYTAQKPTFSDDDLTPAGRRSARRRKSNPFAEFFSSLTTVKLSSRRRKATAQQPTQNQEGGAGRVLRSERRKSAFGGGRAGGFRDHFIRNTSLVCIAVALVSAIAIPTSFAKPTAEIKLNDNGRILEASTAARTVGEFLEDNEIVLGPDDVLEADPSDPIEEGMQIMVRRAMTLTVKSNGQEIEVSMLAGTVQEALDKAGVVPAPDDEVYPSPDTLVRSGMTIEHIIVTTQEATETQQIPFENTTKEDPDLDKGKTKIVQDGEEGVLQITYKQLYKNGVLISQEEVSEDVIQQPVDQVMAVGTYVEPPKPEPKKETTKKSSSSSSSGKGSSSSGNKGSGSSSGSSSSSSSSSDDTDLNGRKALKMELTAYCSFCNSGSKTSSGTYPVAGRTVACNSLPLGTRIYIEGYGEYVVEDRGGMGGSVIDIYMGDQENDDVCNSFGHKRGVTVYVLG